MKRTLSLFFSLVLSLGLLAGCSNADNQGSSDAEKNADNSVVSTVESNNDTSDSSDENKDESSVQSGENEINANQLLSDLKGTYQELWPVILADEYNQIWLDESAKLVGEENAEAAVDKMKSMVTGTLTSEEAVNTYKDGNMAYCCEFLENVDKLTFDGTSISGKDKDGNELFNHSYRYIGMEEIRGLYIYQSDDENSGEFTYFCIAPDTMSTTWHIELRYGSDLDNLKKYDSGKYAYWLGSGISDSCTQEDIKNCIKLFCEENLSE